jgi:hypothetical protein
VRCASITFEPVQHGSRLPAVGERSSGRRRFRQRSGNGRSPPALLRFRALLSDFRTRNAALQAVERALNDRRPVLFSIRAEIDRLGRDARAPWPGTAKAARQRIDELRAQAAMVQGEIDRLSAERERLQRRRDDASAIVSSCRDYLMGRGLSRSELEA